MDKYSARSVKKFSNEPAAHVPPASVPPEIQRQLDRMEQQLGHLPEMRQQLKMLVESRSPGPTQEWYTTKEFGEEVDLAEFTIRKYCREGRLRAKKRGSGRGAHPTWVLHRDELVRFNRDGLLPIRRPS